MNGTNPSRRTFLKTTAGVAAGAALTNGLLTSGVYAKADDTIKIALIGCGGRGSGACSQALSTAGPIKLVAVADAFEDNARNGLGHLKEAFKDKVDVPDDRIFHGFNAYKQAIDSGADVILIATPPGFRPIHFEYAVEKGKQIFMEKPVATDAGGVRRVLAAAKIAKEKGLKVGVGLQRHHDPKYIETVKRIQDGVIGDGVLLRAYWNGDTPWVRPRKPGQTEMEYQMRNWYFFVWLCGDHIVEQHIHNLDVANWVMGGPPVLAQGQGGRQVRTGIDHGEIYDHHFVEFTYKDGTKLLSQCRHMPNTKNDVSEHAEFSKGSADISGHRLFNKGGDIWRYQGPGPDPYQVEHDVFFDAIRNNKPHFEAEYGATSTMTAIWGRMCTYSGQEISWEQALGSQVSVMPTEFDFKANPPTLPDKDGRYKIAMPGVTKVV